MPDTKINPWICPNCGKRLVLKEGRYGRFMACPGYPDCHFTRAMWTYQRENPYCDKCNNTGFIPFIKAGKVIPNVRLFCECHEDEPEYLPPLKPEDFDFAMSYTVYRSLCQEHGWTDPGPLGPEYELEKTQVKDIDEPMLIGYAQEIQTLQEHLRKELRWTSRQWDTVNQLKRGFSYLEGKVNERPDKKKPKNYRVYANEQGIPSPPPL